MTALAQRESVVTLSDEQTAAVVELRHAARAAYGAVALRLIAHRETPEEVGVEIDGRGIDWAGMWLDSLGDWRDEDGRWVRWTALRHDGQPAGIVWSVTR